MAQRPHKSNLFSCCNAQSVGVHWGAVMEQDPGHCFPVLLQVERLIPVPSTLVVPVSRAVEHGEHDGDIQSIVVLVLYVPYKYGHWKAGILTITILSP